MFVGAALAAAVAACVIPLPFPEHRPPEAAPPVPPLSYAVVYTEVQALRRTYRLTNGDLIAIGCSRRHAEDVLRTLVAWQKAHHATLEAVGTRKIRKELRLAIRRCNMGPRDEAVIARVRELKPAHADALRREREIRNTLIAEVEKVLSYEVLHMWEGVRRNGGVKPRYAPWLRAWQARDLRKANRVYGRRTAAARRGTNEGLIAHRNYKRTVAEILSPAQEAFLRKVKANQKRWTMDVFKADRTVLPLPDALRQLQLLLRKPPADPAKP